MTREPLPPEAWQRVKSLFEEAYALPPEQRASFLAAAPGDAAVREEVLALLAASDAAGDAFLEAPPQQAGLSPGERLGPYEIRERVGGGGMGEVYRAHDARLRRDVAVKVLKGWLGDTEARGRFDREARAIAALSHPNVIAVHDVGDASGVPYIVTELLSGETLRAALRKPPSIPQALDWAAQIALGLAAAHEKGIVHRDLKPENLFLVKGGGVKILDFGIAQLLTEGREEASTHPGMILGTARYLAPEVAQGKRAAATADLFALGVILFEMLTGTRAFDGTNAFDTLRAVVERDPPPPSALRPGVPPWLDRVVARCLAKDPAARFQSARDLAFALGTPVDAEPPLSRARRPSPVAALVGTVLGGLLIGIVLWPGFRAQSSREPPQIRPLTHSGRDASPTVSPDGRFVAFASDRDGVSRIWLQQLDVGREAVLTEGPDAAPRFSPDGSQLLFTRASGAGTALYRAGLLGGDVRKVADDASDGDWSPDGNRVVFVRWRSGDLQARPSLMIAGVDGSGERELVRLEYRVQIRPRWSPDGRTIAVTGFVQQPGAPQSIVLLSAEDGSVVRTILTASPVGLVSSVAWEGPQTLLYSQATSVTGNSAGSGARVVRQRLDGSEAQILLWSPESSLVLDRWPGHGVVFDTRSPRENLREVKIGGGKGAFLWRGTATDRQPVYSADASRIVFSSNRGGSLDLWVLSRSDGAIRRLTDHTADEWDPAFTSDGQHLLWSSNRTGNFEVWMADADGSNPRQVTHDGVDAENPSATRDGAWILYSSGAPGRAGVWRIRPDGTDPAILVKGVILPEVSPDGRHFLYQTNRSPRVAVVGVASTLDGAPVDFEIKIDVERPTTALLGRARWAPDGKSIAFIAQDERGTNGVYMQRFAAGEDTRASRTLLVESRTDSVVESFGLSPHGDLVLAEIELRSGLVAATGLPR